MANDPGLDMKLGEKEVVDKIEAEKAAADKADQDRIAVAKAADARKMTSDNAADQVANELVDTRDRQANARGAAREAVDGMMARPEVAQMAVMPAHVYKQQERAKSDAEAELLRSNVTIPGGKFMVNGEWVNAMGDKIDQKGKVLEERH